MMIPEKIRTFLKSTKSVSLGYNEINFFSPEELDEEQVGYSVDPDGKSLITGKNGDWQQEWIVIGYDALGDPILADTSMPQCTVLSATHGEGDWKPFIIADSLDNLKAILLLLTNISKNRTDPDELEKTPISKKERQNLLQEIRRQNSNSEIWFWENFLEAE
jgi:hypothetical protein